MVLGGGLNLSILRRGWRVTIVVGIVLSGMASTIAYAVGWYAVEVFFLCIAVLVGLFALALYYGRKRIEDPFGRYLER